jgi:mannose-6-phosphate isomerase-like protein (cupin superfamily)
MNWPLSEGGTGGAYSIHRLTGGPPGERQGAGKETNVTRAVIRKPGEGRTIAVVGDVYRFLALGEETDGKYALWEAIVPPGGGPPPHVHSREQEGFYVLEGEITFHIGDQRLVASAGMFANMPVGTPHSFKNEGSRPARMLISVAPAGLEQMFVEVGVPLPEGATTALPPSEEEIERLLAVAPRYGIEIRLPAR